MQNDKQYIYLIAICGTGMTALAGMLKTLGHTVKGSDQNVYPPMSTFLRELGIPVFEGFDEAHLEPQPDLVIIGNAMSRGNPEVEVVLEKKLNYTSLPAALREFFIRGRYSCVVAGTHGKTTTSSLLAWVLETAGKDPGFFIGGIPENFGRGFKIGGGEIFVAEGDEYDSAFFDKSSKFLHYLPDLAIVNNIEFDHADIFKSVEDVETAFARFINLIPRNGFLVANWDDPRVRALSQRAFCQVVGFGLNDDAEWRARGIEVNDGLTQFEAWRRSERIGRFAVPLFGTHMVMNALAVVASATLLGLDRATIAEGLRTFKNVRRRLQFVGEADRALVFDDFAHHPTEVEATLKGLRARFPERRLWAVWEPRTATSKRKVHEARYVDALKAADLVIMTPPHAPEKVPPEERLSVESLSERLAAAKRPNWILPANHELLAFLQSHLEPNDVVLFMSNGDFHQIPRKLVERTQI